MDIADEADLQRNSLIENVLGEVAQLHGLSFGDGDIVDQPRSMSDAMCSAVLDGLPDGFLSVALAGVNSDVEILPLDIVKSVHVLLWRVATLFAGEFRHLQRHVHITHGADDQSRTHAKVLATPF